MHQSKHSALAVLSFVACAILLSPSTFPAESQPASVLVDVRFPAGSRFVLFDSALVRDDRHSYLATPGGLYRFPRRITAGVEPELIAFDGRTIHNLAVHEGALYVLKEGSESVDAPASEHTFLRSVDHGETFQPLDEKLEECLGRYCSFLASTEVHFRGGAMIVNAGGNVLSTRDEGKSWIPLVGSIASQACYHPALASVGNRLLIGGECPLDVAYVRSGTLDDESDGWIESPAPASTPYLENRNVQFIRQVRESQTVIAGIEGAILRSEDGGKSFAFAHHQPISGSWSYIYFTTFLASQKSQRLYIGGFDKAGMTAALMTSDDDGRSWKQRHYLLNFDDFEFEALVFLHEDEDGRLLAGLLNGDERLLRIVELNDSSRRRRPIRTRE